MYERDVAIGCIINFPVFMSKPSSYSTRIYEYCVLYSGLLYLHASSVSGFIWKRVNLFSILWMFLKL